MRSRVVYYSRGGTTRLLAEALAARMVAQLAEVRCSKYRPGLWGWLQAGRDATRGHRPAISVDPPDGEVDCVVAGGPVWAGRVSPPLAGFLAGLRDEACRVGVVLISDGGPPHPKAEADLKRLLGRTPDALLMLRGEDVRRGMHMDEVDDFLRDLSHEARPQA